MGEFGVNSRAKDGRGSRCLVCIREVAAAAYRARPDRQNEATRKWRAANLDRKREIQRNWRNANQEHAREWARANYAANAERIREAKVRWVERNKAKESARCSAWGRRNRDKINAKKARRRASKLLATPTWADQAEIRGIYKVASLLGPAFHVDHIVPLRGKTVCGLHWEANLRIVPAQMNIVKQNLYWPDMFDGAAS